LPTNLQNFTKKDLTEVKIFQKVLGGLLFSETPCIGKLRPFRPISSSVAMTRACVTREFIKNKR